MSLKNERTTATRHKHNCIKAAGMPYTGRMYAEDIKIKLQVNSATYSRNERPSYITPIEVVSMQL